MKRPWVHGQHYNQRRGHHGRVFGAFALARELGLKQFGVGLGVAVLVDATVIRTVLLPASMKFLGDLNWYLPKWLTWLPKFTEGRDDAVKVQQAGHLSEGSAPSRALPAVVPVRIDE